MADISTIVTVWLNDVIAFLPTLVFIAVILMLTMVSSRRVHGVVLRLSTGTQAPREITELLARAARFGVLIVGLLLVLGRLGLSDAVISFVAGLGIAGIVVGFALQDIVKQFAAGVLLLMLRPFRVGDEVRVGAFEGRVVDVQLRATVLKTVAGDEVLIPNADVYNSAIVNMSRYDVRRHMIALSLPADRDLGRVRAALTQALEEVPGIADNPPLTIVATGFDGAVVKLEVRFWIDERTNNPGMVTTGAIAAARRALEQTQPEAKAPSE